MKRNKLFKRQYLMMKDQDFKDKQLKSLLQDSKVSMPFSDFEERMLSRLNKELRSDYSIWRNIRLSWIFFFIGIVFGLGGSFVLPMLQHSVFGIDVELVRYPVMMVTIFAVLWQLDEMIKLTLRQRKNRIN